MGIYSSIIDGVFTTAQNEANIQNENQRFQNQVNIERENAKTADQMQRAQYIDLYSPLAQADMIRKAGMSLSTLYGTGGNGGTANGNMAATPAGQPPMLQKPNFNAEYTHIQEIMANQKQMEAMDAQIELWRSEANKNNAETPTFEQDIKESEQRISESKEKVKATQQTIKNMIQERENLIATNENIKADTKKKDAEERQIGQLIKYNEALERLTNRQIEWGERYNHAQVAQLYADVARIKEETKNLGLENEITEKTMSDVIEQKHQEMILSMKTVTEKETNIQVQKVQKKLLDIAAAKQGMELHNYLELQKALEAEYQRLPEFLKNNNSVKEFYLLLKSNVGILGDIAKTAAGAAIIAGAKK